MKIHVNREEKCGAYYDPTRWQNSTLRYAPPEDFPAYMAKAIGRAALMRVWITLDEYWDYRTGTVYPDYDIGVARYPVEELHYPYDWKKIVPAPSGTRFKAYLTSHAREADELMLNVRRLEREVSDGVITYAQYERVFEEAVEYCKTLAPNIRYIECCNEVDIATFGNLSADEYVKLYLCAYRAVKRLNEKHRYAIPLMIGGYAAAHPLTRFDLMREIMARLKESEIGECPMDFYSYHHYGTSTTMQLVNHKMLSVAKLSLVERLRYMLKMHKDMLAELGLPERPIFLDELGKARTTGIDGDALYNAAGLIVYLLALGTEEQPEMYPFPWCTFHNPELQISFTQFLLCPDGGYAMTPNGVAVKMLHDLHGTRLSLSVGESYARDAEYTAVAVEDDEGISVVACNPVSESIPFELTIAGMAAGDYTVSGYHCDSSRNNSVTGHGYDGKSIEKNGEAVRRVTEGGVLRHVFALEPNAFVHYRITPKRV